MLKRRLFAIILLFVFGMGQAIASNALYLSVADEMADADQLTLTEDEVNVESYEVNDANLDALFSSVEEVKLDADLKSLANPTHTTEVKGNDNAAVAFILAWLLGILGIHRAYMGTSAGVVIGYILTCGGLGIVAFIDWVVLLVKLIEGGDISKYVDSTKFFMW